MFKYVCISIKVSPRENLSNLLAPWQETFAHAGNGNWSAGGGNWSARGGKEHQGGQLERRGGNGSAK